MVESSIRTRVARARTIYSEGRVSQHGDLFIVHGDTGNYTISIDHDCYGETCTCPDWYINVVERGGRHTCKHQYAVAMFVACAHVGVAA